MNIIKFEFRNKDTKKCNIRIIIEYQQNINYYTLDYTQLF